MKKVLIALALVATGVLSAQADWLYWQVNDPAADVVSSALYAKVNDSYYYRLGTGTATSGSVEITPPTHSDPSFSYESTSYYIELVSYASGDEKYRSHSDQSFSYSDLHITGSSLSAAMAAAQKTVWSGVTYSRGPVPEPTSGLMMLVGMALLGLKRRRV